MSIQKSILSHDKRELLLKLFELGLSTDEGVKSIGSKMSEYSNTLSSVPFFSRSVQNAKNRSIQNKKSQFIGALVACDGIIYKAVNEVETTSKTIQKWRQEDKKFDQNVSHILGKFKTLKQPKQVTSKTNRKERYYYEKGVLKEIFCTGCNRSLEVKYFHRDNNRTPAYASRCIPCVTIQRIGRLPNTYKSFDYNKNESTVQRNYLGHKTKKRCTQCGLMLGKEEFPFLNRRIPICKDCYDDSLVHSPPKRVEFRYKKGKRIQMRWYDDQGYPTHKRCSVCNKQKELNDFSVNRSNKYDGRYGQCRSCVKEIRLKKDTKTLVKTS